VSFIDTVKNEHHSTQYAVLIRGSTSGESAVEEVYRIRSPYNTCSGRGIVIGEGKPENQNHAICFDFGECLQTIDMNQDNFLLEAMKMRSLLQELKTPEFNPKRSVPKSCKDYCNRIVRRLDRKYMKKPILIGFREWIFSDKAGALGSFAAGTEFAFGTILQRVMTFPGRARFHYGHPDVWDKLFIQTRGGISKATRNLHVSEDVFGGLNAVLRGGKIAYRYHSEALCLVLSDRPGTTSRWARGVIWASCLSTVSRSRFQVVTARSACRETSTEWPPGQTSSG